jgi:hypothetical protein
MILIKDTFLVYPVTVVSPFSMRVPETSLHVPTMGTVFFDPELIVLFPHAARRMVNSRR